MWPSELHRLGYCPRLLFFETHAPLRPSLRARLRMLLGRIYHAIASLPQRLRGYSVEEPLEAKLGSVSLRGRADAMLLSAGKALIIERKSGRAPRSGAWPSDILQAAAYGFILLRTGEASRVEVEIRYRNGSYKYEVGSEVAAAVLRAVDDVVKIKYWGITGHPRRSAARCSRCPYRSVCEELDRELAPPPDAPLYEPGEWIDRERLSPPRAQLEPPGSEGV